MSEAQDSFHFWEFLLTTRPGIGWIYGTASVTGLLLQLLVCLMLVCSSALVRQSGHFEVGWACTPGEGRPRSLRLSSRTLFLFPTGRSSTGLTCLTSSSGLCWWSTVPISGSGLWPPDFSSSPRSSWGQRCHASGPCTLWRSTSYRRRLVPRGVTGDPAHPEKMVRWPTRGEVDRRPGPWGGGGLRPLSLASKTRVFLNPGDPLGD